MIPIGDPLKQKAVLLREGFSSEEIKGVHQKYIVIGKTLQSEADRSLL